MPEEPYYKPHSENDLEFDKILLGNSYYKPENSFETISNTFAKKQQKTKIIQKKVLKNLNRCPS